MGMLVSTASSVSSKRKSALPLLSGTVMLLALVLSAGLGEDVSGSKDKECGVPTCMGDVESYGAPTHIGIVLHTGNPLPKPGARLTAVGVCSTALGTLPGPVLTCD